MAGGDKDSKTEQASPKKRRDARKEGNVFLSNDVVTVVSVLGVFYVLKLTFSSLYVAVRDFSVNWIANVREVENLNNGVLKTLFFDFIKSFLTAAFPVMIAGIFIAIIATGVQTRFIFTPKKASFKFSNLNPMEGIKKMFSMRTLVELLKSLLKITVLIIVLYNLISGEILSASRTMQMDITNSAVYMLNMVMDLILPICLVFTVIAGFDYMYQRWEYEKNLRMTKEEVKEEYKQTEGNPEIKGRIKNLQRQMANQRMMQAVPSADVIVRNPTHYAVALKYDPDKHNAPVLVAKGQDEMALRIVAVGEENGVYVVENKLLARGIYATTKLDQEISPDYYGVVAEILVQVFKANKKL